MTAKPLTAEQRERLDEYLTRYPHPVAVLVATRPKLAKAWKIAGGTNDELDAECLYAVTLAAGRYETDRGASFDTYATLHCKWHVLRILGAKKVRTRSPRRVTADDGTQEDELELAPERTPLRRDLYPKPWDTLRTLLTEREAAVLQLRCGLHGHEPHTLHEIAQLLGISPSRVQRVEANTCRRLRRTLEQQAQENRIDLNIYLLLLS